MTHIIMEGTDGAVVRALASHQCGLGSFPRFDVTRMTRTWERMIIIP